MPRKVRYQECIVKYGAKVYAQFQAKYKDKYHFGGKTQLILRRDNFKCKNCGMPNKEHLNRWGRKLTIDHIDGKGRYSKKKNNNLSNLQTLCLICHGRKDAIRNWKQKRAAV